MKKIFTLISLVCFAMGVSAQEPGDYELKSVTWKAITWKNGNNKKDKDNKDMFFLMGTGNGYASLFAEYYYSEDKGEYNVRPNYSYIDYQNGEKGIPAYGLYYKFTPSTSGTLKITVWVNKGGDNRKVFVVKGSTGTALTPFVDYTFDGYINSKSTTEEDGTNHPTYFNADEFKAQRDAEYVKDGVDTQPYKISLSGQAVWGWITFNVEAGESYVVYQQSSQLGFGGFEFGGESYVASPEGKLAAEFAAVVDADGNATNVNERGSVVTFTAAGVAVEAVGGAEPESVEADFNTPAGINDITTDVDKNAPKYNLAGQRVDKNYKGVVIHNGKKYMNK